MWWAGLIEFVLGIMITLGFASTRIAAFIASGEMAFAYFYQHWLPLKGGVTASFWPDRQRRRAVHHVLLRVLLIATTGAGALSADSAGDAQVAATTELRAPTVRPLPALSGGGAQPSSAQILAEALHAVDLSASVALGAAVEHPRHRHDAGDACGFRALVVLGTVNASVNGVRIVEIIHRQTILRRATRAADSTDAIARSVGDQIADPPVVARRLRNAMSLRPPT